MRRGPLRTRRRPSLLAVEPHEARARRARRCGPFLQQNAAIHGNTQNVRRNYARSEVVEGKGFYLSTSRNSADFAGMALPQTA
jgi:hypothetical protein